MRLRMELYPPVTTVRNLFHGRKWNMKCRPHPPSARASVPVAIPISERERTEARRSGSVDLPAGKHSIGRSAPGHGTGGGKAANSRQMYSVV